MKQGTRAAACLRRGVALPDVLGPDLRIVFCGSAVGHKSMFARAYYAGPGNRFWPTLHEVGLTRTLLAPADYERVLDDGIGLTDLAKAAVGTDDRISRRDWDVAGLHAKIVQYRPRALAFNGKFAARGFFGRAVRYGPQDAAVGETAVWVLPSTSGAARRYWSIDVWRGIAAWLRA